MATEEDDYEKLSSQESINLDVVLSGKHLTDYLNHHNYLYCMYGAHADHHNYNHKFQHAILFNREEVC